RTLATRGSMALISPQPVAPWLVSILMKTTGLTQYVRRPVILRVDVLSAISAAGFFSGPIASVSKAFPAATAAAVVKHSRRFMEKLPNLKLRKRVFPGLPNRHFVVA